MRKLEEQFRENTTLKYYNENATTFFCYYTNRRIFP